MKEHIEHAWQVVFDAASNPKVALLGGVAVPAASTVANKLEVFTVWASAVTGTLAACTGAVVLAVQIIKLLREWRSYQNEGEQDDA